MNDEKMMTLGSLFDGSGGFPLGGVLCGIAPVWSSEIEPFPIRVTTKRFPSMKHYGDVSKLNGAELPPVDIITFGSPCFPAGTLVLTDKGLVEIESIRVGDMVLTHNGRWRRVTAAGAKIAPTIRLRGNHYGLVCTGNHPIYSRQDGRYEWIRADQMQGRLWGVPNKTEYLPIPRPENCDKRLKPMPELSDGFFYFIGRWLGDGWVRDGQRPGRPAGQRFGTIYLCDSADKLHELEQTVSCITDRYSVEHADTCVKVRCNSRLLCDWLTGNFGKYAHSKEIPSWVFSMPEEYRRAMLRGLIESDGYRRKNSVKFTTVSKKLAFGIRILAETLGYSTTIYFTKRAEKCVIDGREVGQRDTYVTEIFYKGLRDSDGDISWYPVKGITPEAESEIVYNLTVEEDNSYTADSIIVHNCQDMSVAGKRSGLDGSRSSLFYEAVRIIREMRGATDGRYPRYIVWENVPGAFSSNKGQDFRAVLEEICRIKDAEVSVPFPGKWGPAGRIVGDGYSVAWRQLDAQFWGVPQRRKRIYLVADLTGRSAGKILFESEGLSGYSAESFRAWQAAAGDPAGSAGEAGTICLNDQGGNRMDVTEEKTCTLRAEAHHPPVILDDAVALENHPTDGRVRIETDGKIQTLTSRMGTGGNNVPLLLKIRAGCEGGGKGPLIQSDRSATLSCNNDQTLFQPTESLDCRNLAVSPELSGTLQAKNNGGFSLNYINPVVYGICSKDSNGMKSANPKSGFYKAETTRTLDANGGNPACNQGGMAVVEGRRAEDHPKFSSSKASFFTDTTEETAFTLVATDYKDPPIVNDIPAAGFYPQMKAESMCLTEGKSVALVNGTNPGYQNGVIDCEYIVRRLTPTECARLQGFPDWWCSDLATPEPTAEDIAFWEDVFETHRKLTGTGARPKTESQIIRWLKEPHTDSAEYKMWGNGVALPNVVFVLAGIAWADGTE